MRYFHLFWTMSSFSTYRVVFLTGPPLKVLSTKQLILARLGVSRTIYVNVDTPNLGFTYRVVLLTGPPLKSSKYKKANLG